MLEVGELAEPHDVLVLRDTYDWIAEGSVGVPVSKCDVVLRLEFEHDDFQI